MSANARDPDPGKSARHDKARTEVLDGTRPRLQWLAAQGMAGSVLVLLLLKIEALAPLAAIKSKLFPLILLFFAEASWLFGGGVGLLLAAQWLIHELAHVRAAQAIGLKPGWMSFIPLTGVYAGTNPLDFGTREREVLVALAGITTGLATATALLAFGVFAGSPVAVLAAKLGFAFNLANLIPVRPFDGGRIFPGALWRYQADATAGVDPASLRLIAACRATLGWVWKGAAKAEARAILAQALVAAILVVALVSGLAVALLPPMGQALVIIAGIAMAWCFFAAVVSLDARAVAADGPAALASRRPPVQPAQDVRHLVHPWADRRMPRAALAIYALAVLAALVGCLA